MSAPPRALDTTARDQRRVRWGLVAIGLTIWLVAIALTSIPLLLLGALVVAFAAYGLLVE